MHNGWLVIDKPIDISSHRLGLKLKKIVGIKKIGHLGTLDPLASGVIVYALNEATKIIPYLNFDQKQYEFTVRWGEQRSTDDEKGTCIRTSSLRPSREDIIEKLKEFIGWIHQVPPVFSAVHCQGKRAYELALKGQPVNLTARKIRIDSCQLISCENDHASFVISCGRGTYVRAIARDLSIALGTVGYVCQLRRTQDGLFYEKHANTIDHIQELLHNNKMDKVLLPLESILDDIPVVNVSEEEATSLQKGQSVFFDHKGSIVWIQSFLGSIGIGRCENGRLHPKRLLVC